MADDTEQTTDGARVGSLSAHASTGRPEDTSDVASGGVGIGEPSNQEEIYGDLGPDATPPAAPQLPLVIGLAVAGLAAAGAVAFLVSHRSRTPNGRSTSLLSSREQKRQLVGRRRRAARPLRRQLRRSTAPLRRSAYSLSRTTRDIQRNVRDVQREAQHRWQRLKAGGRWWCRGMMWGGALGIVIGFLLAPKPGRELRHDISRWFERIRPQAEKLYQQSKERMDRFTQSRRG